MVIMTTSNRCLSTEAGHRCVARAVEVEIWPMERVAEPVRAALAQGEGLGGGTSGTSVDMH